MFGSSIPVDNFYASLDYRPLGGSDVIVEGSTMQFVRLDALVVTVLTYLGQREKRGGYRLKVHEDFFTSRVSDVVSQNI